MLIKSYSKKARFISIGVAYLITSLISAVLLYIITKKVLLNMQSIPLQKRQGYDNPFDSFLALSLGLLLVSLIIYQIINALLPKLFSSITLKIVLGIFSGILPLICLQLITFGISLSDPGMLTEFLVLAACGGLLPIVQKLTINVFNANSDTENTSTH